MDQKHTDMLKQGGHRFQVFPCHLSHSCMFQRFYLKKKRKKIRQQKQKPELDGAHWRLLYCLLFCNADWGCHVEKGYYSFLKLLKNPAGSLKNVWMPSVFASSLFRHKRYTQSLPQYDKAIIKKKIHFGVLSDFCASSVLTLLLAETKAHPRLCFVKRNDAFYRMESKEEKFHPTVCMFKLHKQHRNLLDNIWDYSVYVGVSVYVCVCAECLYTQLWGRVLRYKYCTTGELRRALRSREHFAVPSGGGSDELWWPPIRPLLLHILNRVITITVMNRFLWGA